MNNVAVRQVKRPANGNTDRARVTTRASRGVFPSVAQTSVMPAWTLKELSVEEARCFATAERCFYCSFPYTRSIENKVAKQIGARMKLVFKPPPNETRCSYFVLYVSSPRRPYGHKSRQSLEMRFFEVLPSDDRRTIPEEEVVQQ